MSNKAQRPRRAASGGLTQKEKLKEITEKLEAGVREMFTSEQYAKWLKTMRTFHHYSFNNTLLIALQAPEATHVASYETWKKLNRQVRKGEKGIRILVPAPVKIRTEKERIDPATAAPVLDADGNPVKDIEEHLLQRFKIGHVFSYEQTDGEPLPQLGVDELTGTAENYSVIKRSIEEISPVPIRFEDIEGGAKGYYSDARKVIAIQNGMSEVQTIKTMVHELAHAVCHNKEALAESAIPKDRQTKEVESESIAYTICQYLGLDTSDYSFSYITGWSIGKELKVLRDSMDFIRDTSDHLLDRLAQQMEKHMPEKERSVLKEISGYKETIKRTEKIAPKNSHSQTKEAVL